MTQRLTALMLALTMMLTAKAATRFYTNEQLSSNQITSLCQDRQGYIWIGTEYGLNKFDGVHFTQYYNDDANPQSLMDDIVRQVMTDAGGRLWVVSNRGVQRYSRKTDSFISITDDDGSTANISDMVQTPGGSLWLLSATHGMLEVDTVKMTVRPVQHINSHLKRNEEYSHMFLDGKGRLWLAFKSGCLQMIDTKTGKTRYYERHQLNDAPACDIEEDERHRLTVATYTDILQLDEQTMEFRSVASFERNSTHRLYRDPQGRLFVGMSGSGLMSVDLEHHRLQPMEAMARMLEGQRNAKVHAFLTDRDGNQWIGCYQRGLLLVSSRPDPFRFLPLNMVENNNGNVLRTVYGDSHSHVYIGQETGGITEIDAQGRVLRHWLSDHTVMTMTEDDNGGLWAGTYRNGLYRIDPQTGREQWIVLTGTQRIGSITFDRQGNLYTASFNDGLHSYTPDGQTERVLGKGKLQLTNIYLNKLYTANDGKIWIGHYYGIDVYDPKTDRLVDVGIPETLRPAVVYAIGQSPKDNAVWIGTSKGLFRYGEGVWQRFTTKDGLPNNIVCGLVITADGTVWLSTYRGLGELMPDGRATRYYRGNGLEEWSYLRGVYAHAAGGEVILGNQNGITYFEPSKIKKSKFERGVTLTGMRLGEAYVNTATLSNGKAIVNGPIDETDDITVSYVDNTFSLFFSTMDFRDAQNVHYEFRFQGEAADQWYQTESGRSEIFFSHLAVGSHRLIVRACDNGVYSPEKVLTIHVSPPWYRTWGAYALYLIILASIAALWWRNYWNRRQAEINEDKIKFFVDISHELRSPLTLIKSPLDTLLTRQHDDKTQRALQNMKRNTDRLLNLLNQILSIRKIEKGQLLLHYAETDMAAFVADLCHNYDYIAAQRNITLTYIPPQTSLKAWVDRDSFDKITSNLLNNAFKYVDDGGKIDVELVHQPENNRFRLIVLDTGPGIDEKQLKKVFDRFYQVSARPVAGQMGYGIGLNLSKQLATLHGGTITARNRGDGHGAEFVVTMPLGNSHLPKEQIVSGDYFKQADKTAQVKPVAMQAEKTAKPRRKTNFHVVVADDDEEIRNFLLTELGESYHVHVYADGLSALEGISDLTPDLVISDVMMPQIDGIELLKRVKASTKTSHIPVVLLTTKSEHMARIEGLESGADAYVDKPFNLEELETLAASLIANRQRMKGKFSGMQEQEGTVKKIQLKGNDEALMEKIMEAVNQHLDDSDFNVEALAEAVGLSRVQLHRRMKDMTGISVGEFIRNLRMQQAAALLEKGDITVSQVTYAVGFANPNNFSSAFKKHFGVTPSEYLAKHKAKN